MSCLKRISGQEAEDLWAECQGAQRTRAADMPTEQRAINALFQAWCRLKDLGWREAQYAIKDEVCLFIECGSTGIHQGHLDQNGTIWLHDDGDLWPSHAVLFKPNAPPAEREG